MKRPLPKRKPVILSAHRLFTAPKLRYRERVLSLSPAIVRQSAMAVPKERFMTELKIWCFAELTRIKAETDRLVEDLCCDLGLEDASDRAPEVRVSEGEDAVTVTSRSCRACPPRTSP